MPRLWVSPNSKFVAIFDYRQNPPKIAMEPSHTGISSQGDDPLLRFHPAPGEVIQHMEGRSVDVRVVLPFGYDVFCKELTLEVGPGSNLS
jgi:hypothetical protein